MTLGLALSRRGDLLDGVAGFCDRVLPEKSIYGLLHRERDRLFPDEAFADLFTERGRRSVPPSVVATVMVLQRLEGLSDREAVERYTFDARWRYAAGVGGYDTGGWGSFAHTVLVDMRERLRRSERPDRIFEVALGAAAAAGLVGRRRVLDSTPLYDAVATMDTVTLIRSAIRGLLKTAERADGQLAGQLRGVLRRGDDYTAAGKPVIDWDDPGARAGLVDALARDAYACLLVLDGRDLAAELGQKCGAQRGQRLAAELTRAVQLLATVVGQDLQTDEAGVFQIARKVARDRVISTVDTEARHGHKTSARGFDGYKGHIAEDPDSEIITDTTVTPGNAGDASVAEDLVADLLDDQPDEQPGDQPGEQEGSRRGEGADEPISDTPVQPAAGDHNTEDDRTQDDRTEGAKPRAYGDAAYGTGQFQSRLEGAGIGSGCKTQPPVAPGGRFAKDRFDIDTAAGAVTCPNRVTVTIRRGADGGGTASFGAACASCPLAAQCTSSASGRTIKTGPHEDVLARARRRQADPAWVADYRATRPKVERKLGHLMRRRHGGRRARVRGLAKVGADFTLLAGAVNLARLARLGLHATPTGGWAVAY